MSKTQKAVELVLKEGLTVVEAAKKVGVHNTSVYTALRTRGHKKAGRVRGKRRAKPTLTTLEMPAKRSMGMIVLMGSPEEIAQYMRSYT